MITIDKSTFRDPAYRQRLEALQQRLTAIEAENSFIAYASNRDLLEELEALLRENRERYRQDYLANLQAFQALQAEVERQKAHVHPAIFKQLQEHLHTLEVNVSSHSYDENAAAESQILALAENLNKAVQDYGHFQQAQKDYAEKLSQIETRVWREKYEELKQLLLTLPGEEHIPDANIWQWPDQGVKAAIAEREAAFQGMFLFTKGRKRFQKWLRQAENQPMSKTEFEALQAKIRRRIKSGNVKGYALVALSVVLVALAAWKAPEWARYLDEEKVWEQSLQSDSWTAYQQYLKDYPEGKYRALAKERQLLLDFGKIENIITDDGRVYTYEGELDAGRPHGQGLATFDNGDRYNGEWKAGSFWGQGKMSLQGGSSYEGAWEAGLYHGSGTFQAADGSIYTGDWKNGRKDGQGSLLLAHGGKYLGSWKEGLPSGQGTFAAGDEAAEVFGRQWEAGENFSGGWLAGKPHGIGTMRYADGSIYQGSWQKGARQGEGKMSWPDNSYFDGVWQADSILGKGIFLNKYREDIRGYWKGRPSQIQLLDDFKLLKKAGKFENGLFMSA